MRCWKRAKTSCSVMANSRNSAPAESEDAVQAAVASALSGGMDSMVLLDALAHAALAHPLRVSAVHVHHGISQNADSWARFCAEQCALRNIALTVHRLRLERTRRSLEAAA